MRLNLPQILTLTGLVFLLSGCAGQKPLPASLTASIQSEGLINCVAPNTKDQDGHTTYCEASAVAMLGEDLLFASDKPLQGRDAFLRFKHQQFAPLAGSETILVARGARTASKIEGMTVTPDGQLLIVTTAFDRIDHRSAALDTYNILLAAPISNPSALQIISPSKRQGVTSSLEVRRKIEAHLGLPYFKIEGLVALPGNRLIFGLREMGASHKQFDYKFLLIECQYLINDRNQVHIVPAFKTLLDYNPADALPDAEGLGLSSIEYDPSLQRLYFATSHEINGVMGAYFWHMTLNDLDTGKTPKLLRQADGAPLHTDNKSEGITRLDSKHLFIINDDDRETGGKLNRQAHQAVYQVIQINEP